MSRAREPRSIITAAEQAAAAGDYASAERLLRDAARLQEDRLGPLHPDLANTLNNLGVVCEITSKPADAEQYFRRAHTIAMASLDPDHPFVITSRKNLSDFCEARGKPVDLPTAAPKAPAVRESNGDPTPEDPTPEDPETTSRKLFTRFALGGLGPIAMLMVVLAAGLPRLGAPELAVSSAVAAIESPQTVAPTVAPPQAPADVEPAATPQDTTTVAARDADDTSASALASPVTQALSTVRLTVVRASLCAELDDWSCDPADRPVSPGPLFLYTQIKSASATTIEHRWYREDRLQQRVELRVQASRTGGYRTYSRNLMKSESAGSWRVEVRSEDGALLHEERFTVR